MSSFAKKFSILSGAGIFGSLVGLLLLPLVTRIYGREEFGELAVFAAAVTLFSGVITGKLELAFAGGSVPSGERSELLAFCITTLIGMSVVSLAVLCLVASFSDILPVLTPLFFITAVVTGLSSLYRANVLAAGAIQNVALSKATVSISEPCAQLGLSNLSSLIGPRLPIAYLISSSLECIMLARADLRYLHPRRWVVSSRFFHLFTRHQNFLFHSVPAYMVNAAALHLVPILLALQFEVSDIGEMSVLQRTLGAVCFLLSGVLSQLYFSEFAEIGAENPERKRRHLYARYCLILLILAPLSFFVLSLAVPYFEQVLGGQWQVSSKLAWTMLVLYATQLAVVPLSQTFNFVGKQRQQLRWDIFRFFVVMSVLFLTNSAGLSFLNTIQCYVAAMVVCYLLLIVLHVRFFITGK